MLDDVHHLKLHGKKFRCRRCSGLDFRRYGVALKEFGCVACGASYYENGELEPQLPPRNDWRTPQKLWETLHHEYRFDLDVAADANNTKTAAFFDGSSPDNDALLCDWSTRGSRAWCNPPYQPTGSIEEWLQRGIHQAARDIFSVFLVPMSTSRGWFNDLIVPYAEWHTFRGRISFEDPLASQKDNGEKNERSNPKQDNLLVIYDPSSTAIGHAAVRDARTGERLWSLNVPTRP
jgi:phage N-6-adenine-methyltransferase